MMNTRYLFLICIALMSIFAVAEDAAEDTVLVPQDDGSLKLIDVPSPQDMAILIDGLLEIQRATIDRYDELKGNLTILVIVVVTQAVVLFLVLLHNRYLHKRIKKLEEKVV